MKNKIPYIIGLTIMLLLVGFISVLSVKSAKSNDSKWVLSIGGTAKLRNTIELPLSQVEELEVIYTSNNLKLYPTNGDSIIIKEYLISDKEEAKAQVTKAQPEDDGAGRSKVTVSGNQDKVFTIFGFFAGQERIEIYLPMKGLDGLTLETGSGNITALDEFALETGQLQVTAKSGNIKWQDTKAERITFKANSGNITMSDMEADIEVETGSGNIRLTLPENLSFEFQVQTGSGNIHTNFDNSLSYNKKGNQASGTIGTAPACKVKVEANSGNVDITAD